MSFAQQGKVIRMLEAFLDTRSSSTLTFASELAWLPEGFRVRFFEVAINFIREIAEKHPSDIHEYEMQEYYRMAKRIVKAIDSQE